MQNYAMLQTTQNYAKLQTMQNCAKLQTMQYHAMLFNPPPAATPLLHLNYPYHWAASYAAYAACASALRLAPAAAAAWAGTSP